MTTISIVRAETVPSRPRGHALKSPLRSGQLGDVVQGGARVGPDSPRENGRPPPLLLRSNAGRVCLPLLYVVRRFRLSFRKIDVIVLGSCDRRWRQHVGVEPATTRQVLGSVNYA